MKDIQSASSVSPIKSHFLHEGSAQLRRQHPRASAYCFKYNIFGFCNCWSINCPAFPGTKKGNFLKKGFPRDFSREFVKGVFPGYFLLCLTTVHNK